MKCLFGCNKLCSLAAPFPQAQGEYISANHIDGAIKEFEKLFKSYISEPSRTLFMKKHLRGDDKSWWIPAFCSLSILGLLRKSLLAKAGLTRSAGKSLKECLSLLVCLFIALSLEFDPLMETSCQATQSGFHSRFCDSLGRDHWAEKGIESSFAFLRGLFELDGEIRGDE